MTKSKTALLSVSVLIILVGLSAWLLKNLNNGSQPSSSATGQRTKNPRSTSSSHAVIQPNNLVEAFLGAFKTPIELYGKVVDQHGDPVAGATIKLFPLDTPWEETKSKMTINSDGEGKFSVKGLRGSSIGVQASKKGYLYIPSLGGPASSVTVDYSGASESGKHYSNPTTPVVVMLHKVGPIEPMFYMPDTRWSLPIDGTVLRIALDSKTGDGQHQIEFSLKGSTGIRNEKGGNVYDAFDWTFEAKIPGGGFIWNDSDFNFEAAEAGYKESIRYHYSADMPREVWQRFQHGRYFVKFADGSYGRIRFDIDGGSDVNPLKMTSWLCVKPGSHNLASEEMDGSIFFNDDPEIE